MIKLVKSLNGGLCVYYHPLYSNHPDTLGVLVLVIAPAVFLLCWLFNAHRMGKFRWMKDRSAHIPKITRKSSVKTVLRIVSGLGLGILLGLACRFLF